MKKLITSQMAAFYAAVGEKVTASELQEAVKWALNYLGAHFKRFTPGHVRVFVDLKLHNGSLVHDRRVGRLDSEAVRRHWDANWPSVETVARLRGIYGSPEMINRTATAVLEAHGDPWAVVVYRLASAKDEGRRHRGLRRKWGLLLGEGVNHDGTRFRVV